MNLNKNETNKFIRLLENEGVKLPDHYLDYLTGNEFIDEFQIDSREEPFLLHSLSELCRSAKVDKTVTIEAAILKGYVSTLKLFVLDSKNTHDGRGNNFSLERLSKCVAIGIENNRVLFYDPHDGDSLWIFHPDGGDVLKTKFSLKDLIKR